MNFKSWIPMLPLFCGLLLFSSCAVPAAPEAVFILPRSEGTWQPSWTEMEGDDAPYQYSNMVSGNMGARVWDTPGGIVFGVYGEDCFYFGRYIKSIGRFEPFCDLVACDHFNNECPVGNVSGGIDIHNGTLYVRREVRGSRSPFTGLPEPASGWISEMRGNSAMPVAGPFSIEAGIAAFALCGTDGLYIINAGSLLYLPYGSQTPQTLSDRFPSVYSPVIIGAYLYGMDSQSLFRIDLNGPDYAPQIIAAECGSYTTDGKNLYYSAPRDGSPAMFRCDLEGGNAEVFLRGDIPFMGSVTFDERYMYYILAAGQQTEFPGHFAVFRLRLEGGEPEPICVTNMELSGLYALPTSPDALLVSCGKAYYFLPNTGGELVKIDVPYP